MISKTGFPLLRPGGHLGAERAAPAAGDPRHAERPRGPGADRARGAERRPRPRRRARTLVASGRARRAGQGRAPRGQRATDILVTRRACRVFPGEHVDARAHARHWLHLLGGHRHAPRSRPRRWRTPSTRAKAYVTEAIRGGLRDRAGDRSDGPLLLPAAARAMRALASGGPAAPEAGREGSQIGRLHVITDADPPGPLLARRAGSPRRGRAAPTRSSSARSARGPRGALIETAATAMRRALEGTGGLPRR